MDLHRRFYDFVRGGEVFWLRKLLRGVSCCGEGAPWSDSMVRFFGRKHLQETQETLVFPINTLGVPVIFSTTYTWREIQQLFELEL